MQWTRTALVISGHVGGDGVLRDASLGGDIRCDCERHGGRCTRKSEHDPADAEPTRNRELYRGPWTHVRGSQVRDAPPPVVLSFLPRIPRLNVDPVTLTVPHLLPIQNCTAQSQTGSELTHHSAGPAHAAYSDLRATCSFNRLELSLPPQVSYFVVRAKSKRPFLTVVRGPRELLGLC